MSLLSVACVKLLGDCCCRSRELTALFWGQDWEHRQEADSPGAEAHGPASTERCALERPLQTSRETTSLR